LGWHAVHSISFVDVALIDMYDPGSHLVHAWQEYSFGLDAYVPLSHRLQFRLFVDVALIDTYDPGSQDRHGAH
jgi:hypothetical protein